MTLAEESPEPVHRRRRDLMRFARRFGAALAADEASWLSIIDVVRTIDAGCDRRELDDLIDTLDDLLEGCRPDDGQ